ncbi:hypothetical protein NPIL_290351, partial [Nephila pilipes]
VSEDEDELKIHDEIVEKIDADFDELENDLRKRGTN